MPRKSLQYGKFYAKYEGWTFPRASDVVWTDLESIVKYVKGLRTKHLVIVKLDGRLPRYPFAITSKTRAKTMGWEIVWSASDESAATHPKNSGNVE